VNSKPELFQRALSALRHLQPADRPTALAILNLWAHVAEIDVDQVVNYYFTGRVSTRVINGDDRREGYATGYVDAITAVKAMGRDGLGAFIEITDGHILHTCCGKIDDEAHRNFCEHYGTRSLAEQFLEETAARWEREREALLARVSGCPAWCTLTHDPEDDIRDDMALHMGDDHTDDTVRKLLDAHTLEVRVARLDVLSEGRTGTPNLHVRVDAELTTWQQAAELARTILDAFDYVPDSSAA
jgi:hypothetical protein